MGLDIIIGTNDPDKITTPDYFDENHDYSNKHRLSRTFCNLMCRRNVVEAETELDQIGRITAVDIAPIYQMDNYGMEPDELDFFMEMADTEDEKNKIIEKNRQEKENLQGNIGKVLLTINALIDKLSSIENLAALLDDHGYDTLDSKTYFADFTADKGKWGSAENNFGQDLRNFKRFLEFARDRGIATVYFNYG